MSDVDARVGRISAVATAPRTEAVLAASANWWRERALNAGLTGYWLDVSSALSAKPPAPLDELRIDPIPQLADNLGQRYLETLSAQSRSRNGQHYTPAPLADRLWEMAREALGYPRGVDQQLTGLVRDPACGAGALLLPALREHLRASIDVDPSMVLRALPSKIQGIDLDPWSAWLTNVVLGAELLKVVARISPSRRRPLPVLATVGNGMDAGRAKALVSLQNPPYGRTALDQMQRERFGHVLYGHANLYALFMTAGAEEVDDRGVLAALVPTSFTAGRYFHRLRGYLSANLPIHSINFVHGRSGVFAGVLQETCLVTFRRAHTGRIKVTRSNGVVEAVAVVPAPKGDGPWLLPRESADASIAAAATKLPLTLKTAGWHASTGPLVWNRRKEDLSAHNGASSIRVLWAADIASGEIRLSDARSSLRYFDPSQPSDLDVIVLRDTAILVQRTTAPEQSRRLIAAELSVAELMRLGNKVVVENHINVLRPKGNELISRATLARVLQSRTMDRVVRCISGSVGLSSYELGNLPLPAAEVLAEWENLEGEDLELALSKAFSSVGKR